MKIRTDFVTNSSSSSFIITYKEEINELIKYDKLPEEEKIVFEDIGIGEKIIKDISENSRCSKIKTSEDILKLLKDEYIYDDLEDLQILVDENYSNIYKRYIDLLNKGYKILYFDYISDCSDFYDVLYSLDSIANSSEFKDKLIVETFDH